MLTLTNRLLYWQLAYTINFGLDYIKIYRMYFHLLGPQYLPDPGTMNLLYPSLVGPALKKLFKRTHGR